MHQKKKRHEIGKWIYLTPVFVPQKMKDTFVGVKLWLSL